MSSLAGQRGCTADIIILEEAAYLKPELFHQVIVPLLTVDHTALLAISSPGDEMNYYSILQDLKNAYGDPLFLNIRIGLACDRCIADSVDVCVHQLKRLPSWKSEGQLGGVEACAVYNAMLDVRCNQHVASSPLEWLAPSCTGTQGDTSWCAQSTPRIKRP